MLIDEIAENHDVPEAKEFFRDLKQKVLADRELLEGLLGDIHQSPSALMKIAGGVAARVGGIKLMWESVEPGKLGMFEALEMLAIGIQGKRLLWVVFQEISPWFPEWQGKTFSDYEDEAIRQRDAVERWRIEAALDSLIDDERRSVVA